MAPRVVFAQAMMEPFPLGGTLPGLVQEMVWHAGAPASLQDALLTQLQNIAQPPDIQGLKVLHASQVETLAQELQLEQEAVNKMCMLLRTI